MKRRKVSRIVSLSIISLAIVAGFLISCKDKDEKRSFSEKNEMDSPVKANEIKVTPSAARQVAEGAESQQLQWDLPEGWKAFRGSGMHLAVLKTSAGENAVECTIMSLPGDAGGTRANTVRWLGQLGITLPMTQVDKLLEQQEKIKTKGGFELTLIDFNPLIKTDADQGMLIGVAKPGENSYFIKMMAPKADLLKVKKAFEQFCQSLTLQ